MIDFKSVEFEILCYLQDTKVMTGLCTYQKLVEKFGEKEVRKCMYERKLIYEDRKNTNGMEWTRLGKEYMGF